jgi:hypothetical protein
MKKLFLMALVLIFLSTIGPGCVNSSQQADDKETPVGVRKQHDTRVTIICVNSQGRYLEKSLHKSEIVTCGKHKYKLNDFVELATTGNYIAFPGREPELIKYLQTAKK